MRFNPMEINAFCLNAKGQIVAACGAGPGEVRIVDDHGKIMKSWALEVKPEAVNVSDDNTILVGGEGKGIAVGTRVFHQKFGYGAVLTVDGDKLSIDFEKAGVKKVMDSFVEVA